MGGSSGADGQLNTQPCSSCSSVLAARYLHAAAASRCVPMLQNLPPGQRVAVGMPCMYGMASWGLLSRSTLVVPRISNRATCNRGVNSCPHVRMMTWQCPDPAPAGASRVGAAPSDGASGGSCSMSGVSQHQRRGTRSSVADAGDSGDTSQGSAGGRKRVRAGLGGGEASGVVGRPLRKAGQAAERGFDCSQQARLCMHVAASHAMTAVLLNL